MRWPADACSALIHAATMVTSGIYLMVRSNVLYEIARESGVLVLGLVSSSDLVAYIGAATALGQFDRLYPIRHQKVLAYSTVSQLGFMVVRRRDERLRGRHVPPSSPTLSSRPFALPQRRFRSFTAWSMAIIICTNGHRQ
ncbi:MAG: hypothetical protein H6669_13095 [Ardenticatenaceae bacterium]|nr:hypothetical protein [Ardenticatenaceae bacterium]